MGAPGSASDVSSVWRFGRCGKCINCLRFYRKVWEGRILLEWLAGDKLGQMVTLTYREESRPDPSGATAVDRLGVVELRRWLHAFKERCRKRGELVPSVYWASELGERTGRPHHHVIFLGRLLEWDRNTRVFGSPESQLTGHVWPHGFVNYRGMYDPETARKRAGYVAKYVAQKDGYDVIRCRAAVVGKEALKAAFFASIAARNPAGNWPEFVFSSGFIDLGLFQRGLGTYPLSQSMQRWIAAWCEDAGIRYERPWILDPHQHPYPWFEPEPVRAETEGEALRRGLMRRQTLKLRDR